MLKRLDHVAIVVRSIDETLKFWHESLGLPLSHVANEAGQHVKVAFLPLGESEVELLEPIGSNHSVARYLEKRGEGIHHLCFEVDHLDSAIAHLKRQGVQIIDENPYVTTTGNRAVFIHPRSAHGVLVELYEKPESK